MSLSTSRGRAGPRGQQLARFRAEFTANPGAKGPDRLAPELDRALIESLRALHRLLTAMQSPGWRIPGGARDGGRPPLQSRLGRAAARRAGKPFGNHIIGAGSRLRWEGEQGAAQ